MLVPVEDEYQTAFENALRQAINNKGYHPQTPRVMWAWWREETGLQVVQQELADIVCIEFDDWHDASIFLLKYL